MHILCSLSLSTATCVGASLCSITTCLYTLFLPTVFHVILWVARCGVSPFHVSAHAYISLCLLLTSCPQPAPLYDIRPYSGRALLYYLLVSLHTASVVTLSLGSHCHVCLPACPYPDVFYVLLHRVCPAPFECSIAYLCTGPALVTVSYIFRTIFAPPFLCICLCRLLFSTFFYVAFSYITSYRRYSYDTGLLFR